MQWLELNVRILGEEKSKQVNVKIELFFAGKKDILLVQDYVDYCIVCHRTKLSIY